MDVSTTNLDCMDILSTVVGSKVVVSATIGSFKTV
jgi:hypothetical protein